MPIVAVVGSRPMRNVADVTRVRQTTNAGLRPMRSPRCPKTSPPSGLAMKPAQNVLNAKSVPTSGEASGKKSFPNTRAAAEL